MELVAGLLLWIGDVFGLKWIRKENNHFKKLAKGFIFLLMGVLLLLVYFMIWFQ